jgi:hypothetical protein
MNFDPATQFSMGDLIGRALGLTCLGAVLGLVLAALPHTGLQALGLLRLQKGAKQKLALWLAVIALGTATLIGAATGFCIGVARAALMVARDIGPQVMQTSAENALRAAGVKDFASVTPAQVRELLEQAGKAELPPLPGELAQRLRPEMESSRAKLVEQAKAWLAAQSKDGKLAVTDMVAANWPKVLAELVTWERQFRHAAIGHGVLWILAMEVILAILCAGSRAMRPPVETPSPVPPKLP